MIEIKTQKSYFFGSFFKDLSLYALEPIVSKLVSFLLIPLYTAYLLPSEFGNLQYVLSIGAFLRSFSQMGLNTAFWKFRSEQSGFEKTEVSLSLTLAQLYLSVLVVAGLMVAYFSAQKHPVLTGLLLVYFSAISVKVISENALLLSRANRTPKKYLQISLLQTIFLLIANVLFVVVFKLGVWGIVYGYLSSFTLIGVIYFSYLKQSYAQKHNWKLTFEMLKFGFPVMLANFSLLVLSLSDRWFLKNYTTDLELGLYSFTYKFADLIATFIVYTFQLAWTPVAWKVFDQEDGPEYFASMKKMVYVFFPFFCLFGIGGLTILAQWMTVDKSYLAAFDVVVCLAFSHVFYGFYLFYNTALIYRKKQSLSLIINLSVGVITIGINFLVIPHFGLTGAAWSTLVSYFVLFITVKIVASSWYVHPGNQWKEMVVIAGMLVSIAAVYFIFQTSYSVYCKALSSVIASLLYLLLVHGSGYASFGFLKGQFGRVKQSQKNKENG